MGWIKQRPQHPLWVGRAKRPDVGIEQSNDLSVLTGNAKPLPDRPAFPWRTHDIKAQLLDRKQQFPHSRPIGPMDMDWKGHLGKKQLCRGNILSRISSQGDDEGLETSKFRERFAN